MRTLKKPEEIIDYVGYIHSIQVTEMIIAAQRDALECAAENATVNMEFDDDNEPISCEVNVASILNLLPKDK